MKARENHFHPWRWFEVEIYGCLIFRELIGFWFYRKIFIFWWPFCMWGFNFVRNELLHKMPMSFYIKCQWAFIKLNAWWRRVRHDECWILDLGLKILNFCDIYKLLNFIIFQSMFKKHEKSSQVLKFSKKLTKFFFSKKLKIKIFKLFLNILSMHTSTCITLSLIKSQNSSLHC